jgi:hypothetical protein
MRKRAHPQAACRQLVKFLIFLVISLGCECTPPSRIVLAVMRWGEGARVICGNLHETSHTKSRRALFALLFGGARVCQPSLRPPTKNMISFLSIANYPPVSWIEPLNYYGGFTHSKTDQSYAS